MNLNRNTVCQLFELRSPIWNGGRRVAGLARDRIGDHNEITFSYRRKSDNELSIPDHYYISRQKILQGHFKTQTIGNTVLILVPFTELEILHRVDPPRPEPEVGLANVAMRYDDKRRKKHTTHYACKERMDLYGGETIGCCCTGHECKKPETAEQGALL